MSRPRWYEFVGSVASAALVASVMLVVGSAPAGATRSAVDARPSKVDSRPDRVSAMVTARSQKSRVEDISARTPTSSTYANPDGTWTAESYSGVVRSSVDEDKWVPIDPALAKADGGFEPKAVPFSAEFSDGGDRTLGKLTTANDATIEVGWPTDLPAPHADGDQLTYSGAASGADLVVSSSAAGFNYSVVLDQAPATGAAPLEYRIPLDFGHATPKVNSDGSIVVKDHEDRVATMTAPVMWDSSAQSGVRGTNQVPVTASVEGTGAKRTLVLRPDMAFLRNASTVYPVTVDPTLLISAAADTWVSSASTTNQSSSAQLKVGSNDLGTTKTRSYLYFDLSSAFTGMPAGVLTSAELRVSNYATGVCPGSALRMSQVNSNWNPATMTWATQPTATATGSTTSAAAYGATACPGEGTVSFDATAIVGSWIATSGANNRGVQIKADDETVSSGYREFRSTENGDATKAPKLSVTYNAYPSTPTAVAVSPGYTGYASSTTPTLSAVISDPDAGPTRGYFEVKSGTTVVWSGSSPMSTSGARVEVTVPSGVLTDGSTYTVAAYSQDSALKSQTAATKTFTVDTTPPTVAITSSGFTNNSWSISPPTSATFTFDGTADTGGFLSSFDGVVFPGVPANSSGDFTTTAWTPTPGWHTWEVTPVDEAGNQGPQATFSFGVGPGSFNTPGPWTQSTSSFSLQISAPPNATGATLQWQVYGEPIWHNATQLTAGGSSWNGSVTTSGGRSVTPELAWKATTEPLGSGTLSAPALVLLRACFQYSNAADSCAADHPLILSSSARGGNYPEAALGPASVALFTGEAMVRDVDAADSKAGLGRTFNSFDDATLTGGVFGPGWSEPAILAPSGSDAKASVVDNRTKDGSIVIVDPDNGAETFVLKSGSSTDYIPLQPTGDATALTFTAGTGGNPDSLEISRPLGSGAVKTTWTLQNSDSGGGPAWTVEKVDAPGTAVDTTVFNDHQRPTFIRESDPSTAATCNATTQTVGCRGIKITYTGTGAAIRVAAADRVIGSATQAGVTVKPLATYSYDTSGKLASVCSAAPAVNRPTLCVNYSYTTVAGRTLLAQMTPPGLKAWRFDYDALGRLTTVKREKPAGGDATWSVDYTLSVSSSGLPDLSAATVAQWGQQTVPAKVIAVYQPFTGVADVTKAELYYTTSSGTTLNTASYGPSGWLVDTSWYDVKGQETQHLDATGWARVQAAAQAHRAEVAADASSYTVYNTWGGPNVAGTRVVETYGPAHTAILTDGTLGIFRTHTKTIFDDDPNVDPALIANRPTSGGLGLIVKEITSTSDAARTTDFDSRVTKYGYDPVVTGDGNGWTLGRSTTVSVQADASNGWSVQTARFDTSGRTIESRQPGGSADGSGAGSDAHATVTSYYSAAGSGDCGARPAWDGLVCKVGPAGQPAGPTMPTTYVAAYSDDLKPTDVQEISGGVVTRTKTPTYDNLGRVTAINIATLGAGVTNETLSNTRGYDDNTGLPTTIASNGKTITTGYDTWGREVSYSDALGTSSATTYNGAGEIGTFNDGIATYALSYDNHGWLTDVDAGGGVGNFSYDYTPSGNVATVTYPNGVKATQQYDEVANAVGLAYSQGPNALLAFSAADSVDGRVVGTTSPGSSQRFGYDLLGRLANVQDSRSGGCTTRSYGFDSSSNRTSFNSYGPVTSTGACQTTTASIGRSNSYDSAGRIRNTGYVYDTLGRATTLPQADSGSDASGPLTATYRADDMVAAMSQSVLTGGGGSDSVAMTYGLDPAERIDSIVTSRNGAESQRLRYRYAGGADVPSIIQASSDGGTSWSDSRYVALPYLGAVAISEGGAATFQLANMHGDVVGTMASTPGATTISAYSDTDEFGNRSAAQGRYGWLGSYQRSSDALGGLTLMGARLYNPASGLFTSPDPVRGGNRTAYGYPEDPVNQFDTTGRNTAPGDGGGRCKCSKSNSDWQTIVSSPVDWGPWKSIPVDSSEEWIREGIESMSAGYVSVLDEQTHKGTAVIVDRRCGKDNKWHYRETDFNYSQHQVKLRVGRWPWPKKARPAFWVPGPAFYKTSVIYY